MREEGDLVVEGFVAERCIGEMWARVPREPREPREQRIRRFSMAVTSGVLLARASRFDRGGK